MITRENFKEFLFLFVLGLLWHFVVFLVGIYCDEKRFDYTKKIYQPYKFEDGGKFYQKKFKIKSWKDKLPQHVGKKEDDFSKEHIEGTNIDYIDRFVLETCRAEWIHFFGQLFSVVLLLIAPIGLKLSTSIAMCLIQAPFIIIQRYNRFRLVRYKEKLIRAKK